MGVEQFGGSSHVTGPSEVVAGDMEMSLCFVLLQSLIIQSSDWQSLSIMVGAGNRSVAS